MCLTFTTIPNKNNTTILGFFKDLHLFIEITGPVRKGSQKASMHRTQTRIKKCRGEALGGSMPPRCWAGSHGGCKGCSASTLPRWAGSAVPRHCHCLHPWAQPAEVRGAATRDKVFKTSFHKSRGSSVSANLCVVYKYVMYLEKRCSIYR